MFIDIFHLSVFSMAPTISKSINNFLCYQRQICVTMVANSEINYGGEARKKLRVERFNDIIYSDSHTFLVKEILSSANRLPNIVDHFDWPCTMHNVQLFEFLDIKMSSTTAKCASFS